MVSWELTWRDQSFISKGKEAREPYYRPGGEEHQPYSGDHHKREPRSQGQRRRDPPPGRVRFLDLEDGVEGLREEPGTHRDRPEGEDYAGPEENALCLPQGLTF